MMIDAEQELKINPFLAAIGPQGELHSSFTQLQPFDALFVPITSKLTAFGRSWVTTDFLASHMIRFDDGYGQTFRTIGRKKGRFTDVLDKVIIDRTGKEKEKDVVAGGGGGRAPVAGSNDVVIDVLKHLPPTAARPLREQLAEEVATLNIFLIGDVMHDPAKLVVTAVPQPLFMSNSQQQQQGLEQPSTIGQFIAKLANFSWQPKKGVETATAPDATAVSTGKKQFAEFQQRMNLPAAKPLVKELNEFVQFTNDFITKAEAEGRRVGPKEISAPFHEFIDRMLSLVAASPAWAAQNDSEASVLDQVAEEGFEKYISTKLYPRIFGADDRDQDALLKKKLTLLKRIVKPHHVGLKSAGVVNVEEWVQAIGELDAIGSYMAPRDKLVCVANCCILLHAAMQRCGAGKDIGADDFLPCLVLCVARANPDNLISNVTFIEALRRPDRLESESGYFLTSLHSAAEFWLHCRHDQLQMTDEEFQKAVSEASSGSSVAGSPTSLIGGGVSPQHQQQQQQQHQDPTAPPQKAQLSHKKWVASLKEAVEESGLLQVISKAAAMGGDDNPSAAAPQPLKPFGEMTVTELFEVWNEVHRLRQVEQRAGMLLRKIASVAAATAAIEHESGGSGGGGGPHQ